MTSFEVAMREACGIGSKPILVYATDSAMEEAPEPLSDALKTFVKFDNRHFKQELAQAEQQQAIEQQDVDYVSTLRAAGIRIKQRRSDSMDSMATNQASAGDLDDDMRDAPFERDEALAVKGTSDGMFDADEAMPALVDVSVTDDVHSEQLARVSLDDDKRDSTLPPTGMPEMQERANSPLLIRPTSGIFFADKDEEGNPVKQDIGMGIDQ